jgi:dipeptidyl-peptidase-4
MKLAKPILIILMLAAACRAENNSEDSFLQQYAETYRFTLGQPTAFEITDDGSAVLFLRSGPRSFVRDLYEFDVATGKERLLASAQKLLGGGQEKLTAEELARRERMRSAARGIAAFDLSSEGRQVLIPLSGSLYVLDRKTGKSRELTSDAGYPIDPRFSPDGKSIAVVRNGDLYVIDVETGDERRLTTTATKTLSNGEAEFVAQEEMDRMHGYWWSPDSTLIAYQETDTSDVEELHIADPMKPGSQAKSWRYPRPGHNNATVRLGIVPASGGRTKWVNWDHEQFPYLASVTWQSSRLIPTGLPLTILLQNRDQTEEQLLTIDARNGITHLLFEESDAAWINIDPSMPYWLADGRSFLWTTERIGNWKLERRSRDGTLEGTLTDQSFGFRDFAGVDAQATAYVVGGDEPTQAHLYEVSLKPYGEGHRPKKITNNAGMHSAKLAKDADVRLQIFQPLEGEPRYEVYRGDKLAGTIKSVAEKPPFAANIELTTASDDPPLRTAIVRPRDFDAKRKYPVLVHVYGGPHHQEVVAVGRKYLLDQWLADRGFVIVMIDGRGTPNRGREFERAIKGNFVDVALADQVRGLKALGDKYDELDLSRVGIYGWSFGGYMSAMAVMKEPEVFHAGVAGAPVTDWLDYDTHYTERYLGLPDTNPAGYEASSVLTHAPRLERPLLIIHGTADDNVYFLHSMKLCDALFRAGKPYEFLPLPGFTHMVPDPQVTVRLNERIADFFEKSLRSQRNGNESQ